MQAVGGINEKIEGYFDLCAERGLAGDQGVVIPRDNVQTLMLRQDVVAAVAAGRFHVFAVDEVDEAMELLTGRPAGIRDDGGRFPEASVNGLVDARLASFAETARAFVARQLAP